MRPTTSIPQALERLAPIMGWEIQKVTRAKYLMTRGADRYGPKQAKRCLGFLADTAMRLGMAEVRDAVRFDGKVPFDGIAPHEASGIVWLRSQKSAPTVSEPVRDRKVLVYRSASSPRPKKNRRQP